MPDGLGPYSLRSPLELAPPEPLRLPAARLDRFADFFVFFASAVEDVACD